MDLELEDEILQFVEEEEEREKTRNQHIEYSSLNGSKGDVALDSEGHATDSPKDEVNTTKFSEEEQRTSSRKTVSQNLLASQQSNNREKQNGGILPNRLLEYKTPFCVRISGLQPEHCAEFVQKLKAEGIMVEIISDVLICCDFPEDVRKILELKQIQISNSTVQFTIDDRCVSTVWRSASPPSDLIRALFRLHKIVPICYKTFGDILFIRYPETEEALIASSKPILLKKTKYCVVNPWQSTTIPSPVSLEKPKEIELDFSTSKKETVTTKSRRFESLNSYQPRSSHEIWTMSLNKPLQPKPIASFYKFKYLSSTQ